MPSLLFMVKSHFSGESGERFFTMKQEEHEGPEAPALFSPFMFFVLFMVVISPPLRLPPAAHHFTAFVQAAGAARELRGQEQVPILAHHTLSAKQ